MKTILISSVAVLFLFFSVDSVIAQQKQKFKRGINKERIIDKLNLTDEQESKIAELRTNHQKKMADYKAELEKARIDMRSLRNKSDVSRQELVSATEKMNEVKNLMAIERTNHWADVYELLNDEQKEIWKENRQLRDTRGGFGSGERFNHRRFNCL